MAPILRGISSAVLLFAVLGTTGCADKNPSPLREVPDLNGTSWELVRMNELGPDTIGPLDFSASFMINAVDNGTVINGTAGCNYYRAEGFCGEKTIRVHSVSLTKRLCARPRNIMALEAEYIDTLQKCAGWSINAEGLILSDENGGVRLVYSGF